MPRSSFLRKFEIKFPCICGRVILERKTTKEETERLISKAVLQERGCMQAHISSQIQNTIDNAIPSLVDAFKIVSTVSIEVKSGKQSKSAAINYEDANHKFLRSLPPAWDSLAMTMRTKKNIDTLSIDDLYNNLSVFEQDIQKTSSSSLTSDNVAFLSQAKASSSKHKPSHNSGSYSSYTTSSSKATPTATPGLADEVIHSFLATNADDVDLIHEDLDQIDDLDLEEMDINWQIAMTAIKIKKFYKKTGRRPRVDGKMHVAFDKRKVECFNCHNTGHFARECKFKGSKEGSRQEASRGQDFKPVRTEKEALMTIDEGQINWVEQTTDEELNHALMAFTVNNEVSMCSKLCLDSFNALKAKYDELQSEFGDQEAALTAHKLGLKKLESQLRASHKQQISLNEKLHFQANQIFEKDEKLKKYRRIGMKAVKDKDALQKIVDSWFASSKNLWKLIDCGMSSTVKIDRIGIKECKGTKKKMAREAALKSKRVVHTDDRQATPAWNNTNRVNKANQFNPRPVNVRPNLSTASNTIKTGRVNVNTGHGNVNSGSVHVNAGTQVKSGASRFNTGKQHVNSGSVHVNAGTQIKSGASRFNTGKQHINSGCVHINTARVNRPVSNKTSPKPSQVNFNSQNKCFSKQSSPVNRPFSRKTAHESNKYAVKGKMGTAVKTSAGCVWRKITPLSNTNSGPTPDSNVNVSRGPQGRPKPMKAWGTITEQGSILKRLGHLNFKNLNKLVKDNLVRGLPSKSFKNDHTCVACQKGKQHKASCKAKIDRYVTHPLHTLHMDLFGPTSVRSINHASYCLVITDDCSRFCWVFFLAKKDETSDILKTFIRQIENQLNQKVKIIRSDNGTEFKNRVMLEFCGEKGIKQEFSNARTPQQNGVAERMNRTLIEAARTMLADSHLPTTFWAEAVNTACYTFNRVRVTKPQNKTPYELLFGHKPILSYIRPFGCHVTILNTLSPLGKFDGKSDEGFLVGYSVNSSKEVIDIDVQTEEAEELLVVSSTSRKAAVSENIATKKTHSSKKPSSTPISNGNLNTGNEQVTPGNIEVVSPSANNAEEVFSDEDDDEMPEIRIYDKSSEGVFEQASYDDDGIITDFYNHQ
ncbi:putative ribonuclease H-like domain-containing protein [Tanacetum coccineum]